MGLCAAHLLFVTIVGRLPRLAAALLMAAFVWFLWAGLR
jgi:hypothetical protein